MSVEETLAVSTAEIVAKLKGLQNSSEQLSSVISNAAQELVRQADSLSQLAHGSRRVEEAASVILTSSRLLNRAATSLRFFYQAGEEYMQNATE